MSAFVDVRDLTKSYGELVAVDDLSFTVEPGEIFGFLGPNGAGKSTTLNVLCGLTGWDRGSVTVAGFDLKRQSREIRQLVGLVPQEVALYQRLTARENVEFFASLYGLRGAALKAAAAEALAFVGLEGAARMRMSKMSGGMKRRLNIACGIAHSPKLVVLDEPTVGVDAQSREHIMDSIRILRERGATIIYTSHYMPEVQEICDRIAIIDHGRLVGMGTEEELLRTVTDFKTIVVTVAAGASFDIDSLSRRLGVLPDVRRVGVDTQGPGEDAGGMGGGGPLLLSIDVSLGFSDVTSLLAEFVQASVPIQGLTTQAPSLETTFLALTGRELRE
jgi:ABC-2 type transport system ATP-binding protein